MEEPPRSFTRDDYTVGWICALSIELSAARNMLDEKHHSLPKKAGDDNCYYLGRIGCHNIVIACLPVGLIGNNSAATVAKDMMRSYKSLKVNLLVGIAAGAPGESNDIRLGDIVVSRPEGTHGGVLQYDFGKRLEGGRLQRTGSLDKPPRLLLQAIAGIQATHDGEKPKFHELISQTTAAYPNFTPPSRESDILFKTTYSHKEGEKTCTKCDPQCIVPREARPDNSPLVHYGNIASGNQVVRDAVFRDRIAKEENIICFEMEAAGSIDNFKCLVIRGICDYADSHKNKHWQKYAAVAAAAFAKELLLAIPEEEVQVARPEKVAPAVAEAISNEHWLVPRAVSDLFTGRKSTLEKLEQCVLPATGHKNPKQRRFVLVGPGGMGKSEVCLKFVERCRNRFWGVFWIDTSSEESAKRCFIDIAEHCGVSAKSIEGVRSWLSSVERPWLLILDNADDAEVDYSKYFPPGKAGSVLVATREPNYSSLNTVGCEKLEGLDKGDAEELLFKATGIQQDSWQERRGAAERVVKALDFCPLAIVQAGAYIRGGYCALEQFPDEHSRCSQKLMRSRPEAREASEAKLYTTFELCAKVLETSDKPEAVYARDLLHVLALLHSEDVAETIFEEAGRYSQKRRSPPSDALDRGLYLSESQVSRVQSLSFIKQGSPVNSDGVHLRQARDLLVSLRFLAFDDGRCTISVYRPVHKWLRSRMDKARYQETWLDTGSILALATQEKRSNKGFPKHVSQVEAYFSRTRNNFFASHSKIDAIRAFYWLVWNLKECQAFPAAGSLARVIFEAARDGAFAPDSSELMALQFLYGSCVQEDGDNDAAIPLLTQVVEKGKAGLAAAQPYLLQAEKQLARCHGSKGFDKAIRLFKEIVDSQKIQSNAQQREHPAPQHGPDQPFKADTDKTELDKAAKLLGKVTKTPTDVLRPEHPERQAAQFALAKIHEVKGELEMSVKLLKDLVQAQSTHLLANDPSRLATQHQLGTTYTENGRFEKAIELLAEVVKREKTSPVAQPADRLISQHELARAYSGAGQHDKAAKLLERITKADKETLSLDHPDRLASMLALAQAYRGMRKPRKSVDLLRNIAEACRSSAQADGETHVTALKELALAYSDEEQHKEALDVMKKVIKIQKATLPPRHPALLQSRRWLTQLEFAVAGDAKQEPTMPPTPPSNSIISPIGDGGVVATHQRKSAKKSPKPEPNKVQSPHRPATPEIPPPPYSPIQPAKKTPKARTKTG